MSVKNYSRLKSVLLALLIIPMSFLATAQTPDANNTLYVNSNVTGGNGSGDSWENAIPQLSDALKYARLQYNADNTVYDAQPLKIFVAKGTYKPLYNARDNYYTETGSATVGYTDKDNAFVMVKNVQVYGGFDPENGIDDLTDTRIFGANGSVLSAEVGYDHISGDEAYHVVISSGAVGSALLNGFTLRDAYSNYLASGYIQVFGYYPIFRGSGGAISCIFSSPTIENCIITKNLTSQAGGIFNYQTASPTIINCTFIDNGTTGNGGAIYNSTNSSPTIINCNFTDNGGENGGAIYNATNSNPIITNCSFTDNSSRSNGGGAIYNIASSPIITNSLFANNSARNSISVGIWEEKNGGAIYNETTSSPVLTNVTIADNLGANTVYSTGSGSTTFNNSIVFGTVSAAYTAQNSLIEGNTDFTNGNINMHFARN
jgi:predicted outer membrane repeat protein